MMKNKSRRVSSISKRQKNKTRKNKKGGTRVIHNGKEYIRHGWQEKFKSFFGKKNTKYEQYKKYEGIVIDILIFYYTKNKVMPQTLDKNIINNVREYIEEKLTTTKNNVLQQDINNFKNILDNLTEEELNYLNTIYIDNVYDKQNGYGYFCNLVLKPGNEYRDIDPEQLIKCKLGWKNEDYKQLIEYIKTTQNANLSYLSKHLNINDIRYLCKKFNKYMTIEHINRCVNGKDFNIYSNLSNQR